VPDSAGYGQAGDRHPDRYAADTFSMGFTLVLGSFKVGFRYEKGV
jgi:hypothetical protein